MSSREEIVADILKRLETTEYACSSLQSLSGGSANFTFRGKLKSPLTDEKDTVIIKQAEPYIAANPAHPYDSIRSHYEATMLRGLGSFGTQVVENVAISFPGLYLEREKSAADQSATIVIEDYQSSTDLKSYLSKHDVDAAQARRLGQCLGQWTHRFHDWAKDETQQELMVAMSENKTIAHFKCFLNFGRLESMIEKFPNVLGDSRELFQKVFEAKKHEMETQQKNLLHGDFWTGNILIRDARMPDVSEPFSVMIIDWEMSFLSDYSYDLGQLFAELFQLQHYRNIDAAQWIISSFADGYGQLDEELAFRIAALFGTHLIVWGGSVPGWGEPKAVEDCVRIGNDFLRHAVEMDREWFRGGVLHGLFFREGDCLRPEKSDIIMGI